MKVSVSLPEADIRFLDEFAQRRGLDSRSAALHRAVDVLRTAELAASYSSAFEEWSATPDADDWEPVAGDGVP